MKKPAIWPTVILSIVLLVASCSVIRTNYAPATKGIGQRNFAVLTKYKKLDDKNGYGPDTMFDLLGMNSKNGYVAVVGFWGDPAGFYSKYFFGDHIGLDGTFYTTSLPWNFVTNKPYETRSDSSLVNFARTEMMMIARLNWADRTSWAGRDELG